jgi:hypothetical protein
MLWSLLCAVLIFTACGINKPASEKRGPAVENEFPVFDTINAKKFIYLYEDEQESSPYLNISLSYLNITGFFALQKNFQNAFYQGFRPAEYIDDFIAARTEEYREQKDSADSADRNRESLNWQYRETISLYAGSSKVLVVSQDKESYTGGAHGMTERNYYVFNLADGKRLSLEDILEKGAMSALQKLAEEELRKALNIGQRIPLTEEGFFNDTLDTVYDFYINSQGLGIQWDPYEIAPYVMGPLEVVIPTYLVESLLNPLGRSLIDG